MLLLPPAPVCIHSLLWLCGTARLRMKSTTTALWRLSQTPAGSQAAESSGSWIAELWSCLDPGCRHAQHGSPQPVLQLGLRMHTFPRPAVKLTEWSYTNVSCPPDKPPQRDVPFSAMSNLLDNAEEVCPRMHRVHVLHDKLPPGSGSTGQLTRVRVCVCGGGGGGGGRGGSGPGLHAPASMLQTRL